MIKNVKKFICHLLCWRKRKTQASLRKARLEVFQRIIQATLIDEKPLIDVGRQLLMWAYDLHDPASLSESEKKELAAQGRAAICERHKRKVQRKKEADLSE